MRYIRDPMIDPGVATLTVAAGVSHPQHLTPALVEPFVDEMLHVYIAPYISNYLGNVVFYNVNFANRAFNNNPKFDEVRRKRLRVWLHLYRDGLAALDALDADERKKIELAEPGEPCIFSGDPALIRVSKVLIPLSPGEESINFSPQGRPRLPISGWCLLALLALPMGTLNSGGRVLLPHTHDYELLEQLVGEALRENRAAFQLEGQTKRPNYRFPRTEILSRLLDIKVKRTRQYPLTVYHFTSAADSSKIDIYQLPSNVLSFVDRARSLHGADWKQVVERAWSRAGQTESKDGAVTYNRRNFFYEDLFNLPARAPAFLRLYLLRKPLPKAAKDDPRREYSVLREHDVISWPLIRLFLEKVMDMDKTRLDAIVRLGDRLAQYIDQKEPKLYGKLYRARRPDHVRMELIRAANRAKDSGSTLLPLEDFVAVFFVDEGQFLQPDWFLAYDLLLIRVIEKLSAEVIEANRDDIEKTDQDDELTESA